MTERKIYPVLDKSPFSALIVYDFGPNDKKNLITYMFSSNRHREKFFNGLENNREEVKLRLRKRYRLNVAFDLMADFYWYGECENRGFLVDVGGEKIRWRDGVRLIGGRLMIKS